ncbi:MAG: hypothetical protein LBF27_28530 [Sphingobacterium sp.]|jgi:hypothetical protein|nr:hypothetical protein [Sphingobacterium sp.]
MERPKILCIHGIGGKDESMWEKEKWAVQWRKTLKDHLRITKDEAVIFMEFDSYFSKSRANAGDYVRFFTDAFLASLGITKYREGGITYLKDNYPDMVIEYLQNHNNIKRQLWASLRELILKHKPQIIYAHSLGSMMAYDFFKQQENSIGFEDITLVTAGSQLGNNAIMRAYLGGSIVQLPIKKWYNLNNNIDLVFACRDIIAKHPNFKQVETFFFEAKTANHNGWEYLNHKSAIAEVWKSF